MFLKKELSTYFFFYFPRFFVFAFFAPELRILILFAVVSKPFSNAVTSSALAAAETNYIVTDLP